MSENQTPLSPVLNTNIQAVKTEFAESSDLIIRKAVICRRNAFFVSLEGMCDELKITTAVITPLTNINSDETNLKNAIINSGYKGNGINELKSIEEICDTVIGGNIALILDGENTALSFGVQGFAKKGISEPQNEQNEKGSQEGFTDSCKDNISLLRRKLRTPKLTFEKMSVGKTSNTPLYLCYLHDRTDEKLLTEVRNRIQKAELDTVLGSGYIRPFLDGNSHSFFSDTGITERPDILAGKLTEGRIGIIVDGTPFAVTVPYLLSDYFHSLDDYLTKPYYAAFIRILRIACFITAVTLPGLFVAVCIFHPEVLPAAVMYDIAAEEAQTPFPLMAEALTIHLIYEIVREAGLRMPRAIGHAVSIVGALVIGDAAVTAGLIAAPMLIIVALTTVCSSVVAKLHEPVTVMRLIFIIAGGTMGFYGIFMCLGLFISDICSLAPYGIPFSAPFSPFVKRAQLDNILRAEWTKLGKSEFNIRRMKF